MIVQVEQMRGAVQAPPSKSALHRRLILNHAAGYADVPVSSCTDVQTTYRCLTKLGTDEPLDCGDCGAALRFLLPFSALYGGGRFCGDASLAARPVLPLLNVLREHGVSVSSDSLPLSVDGVLRPGDYRTDGGISSQFFSGLMLTLPFLPEESTLRWTSPIGSLGYIRLTEEMLKAHGVRLTRIEDGYRIPGGQKAEHLPLAVEGDWSCAAPMLILGAVCGSVTVHGLSRESMQPDRKVLSVLEQCGAHVQVGPSSITVSKGQLSGFKCSGADAPDLIPVLAALACASEGDSVLYRLERLRYKESDRFSAICRLLASVGADYETERDSVIVIHGCGCVKGGFADVPPDHRMVMAAAVTAACSANPVDIPYAQCVQKSYPLFFDDFRSLGGQIHAV